jgi:hypothetical protein
MKKYFLLSLLIIPAAVFAQGGLGIGVKGGLNFANVTKASSISNSSRTGFNAGIFIAPSSKGILSSRTELIFSRQGYNYKSSTNTGSVDLNYLMIPQYMAINITKYFQIQLGGQMAFLLNAKADSSTGMTTGNASADKMLKFYNRFDYGYGGGIEIHPVSGLLIGARINISLGDMYKTPEPGQQPSFFPSINVKNNVFQVFAGWKFGRNSKDAKKKPKKQPDNQQSASQ